MGHASSIIIIIKKHIATTTPISNRYNVQLDVTKYFILLNHKHSTCFRHVSPILSIGVHMSFPVYWCVAKNIFEEMRDGGLPLW
jgi:hypothetical protein